MTLTDAQVRKLDEQEEAIETIERVILNIMMTPGLDKPVKRRLQHIATLLDHVGTKLTDVLEDPEFTPDH